MSQPASHVTSTKRAKRAPRWSKGCVSSSFTRRRSRLRCLRSKKNQETFDHLEVGSNSVQCVERQPPLNTPHSVSSLHSERSGVERSSRSGVHAVTSLTACQASYASGRLLRGELRSLSSSAHTSFGVSNGALAVSRRRNATEWCKGRLAQLRLPDP